MRRRGGGGFHGGVLGHVGLAVRPEERLPTEALAAVATLGPNPPPPLLQKHKQEMTTQTLSRPGQEGEEPTKGARRGRGL